MINDFFKNQDRPWLCQSSLPLRFLINAPKHTRNEWPYIALSNEKIKVDVVIEEQGSRVLMFNDDIYLCILLLLSPFFWSLWKITENTHNGRRSPVLQARTRPTDLLRGIRMFPRPRDSPRVSSKSQSWKIKLCCAFKKLNRRSLFHFVISLPGADVK